MTDPLALTQRDINAFAEFRTRYPSWWWTLGACDRSRDFTAAPQERSPDFRHALPGNDFDLGFSCDHRGTLADAIRDVMRQIEESRQADPNSYEGPNFDPGVPWRPKAGAGGREGAPDTVPHANQQEDVPMSAAWCDNVTRDQMEDWFRQSNPVLGHYRDGAFWVHSDQIERGRTLMLDLMRERDALRASLERDQNGPYATVVAGRDALAAVVRDAIIWHEAQDKALSKQPPSGDRGWRRNEHQEQAEALRAALATPTPNSPQRGDFTAEQEAEG